MNWICIRAAKLSSETLGGLRAMCSLVNTGFAMDEGAPGRNCEAHAAASTQVHVSCAYLKSQSDRKT